MQPSCPKFWHSLGKAYERNGLWKQAADAYQRACDESPFDTTFWMCLVKPLLRLKRFDRIVAVCNSCIALDQDHQTAHYKCAQAYKALGKCDDALRCYRRHLRVKPGDEKVCNNKASRPGPVNYSSKFHTFFNGYFDLMTI